MKGAEKRAGGWFSRWLPASSVHARRPRCSAYLSIFNDWELLAPVLASIAPWIDELVVVDGAYSWMAPYLQRLGIDPERSDARVYETLGLSGIPYRVVSRLWVDEIEKRRAGYEACSNRYVMRVDADEILHFDEAAMEAFFTSGDPVGEMDNPLYVAPGYVIAYATGADLWRIGFLFDRYKISSDLHLHYIWLVLAAEALPSQQLPSIPKHSRALAFSAHLTGWRTAETATQRSAFYVLNRMRQSGTNWFEDLRGKPLDDLEKLFSRVPAEAFRNMLRHAGFSLGTFSLADEQILFPTPLSPEQERVFVPLYDRFLASLAAENLSSKKSWQSFGWGGDIFLDLSTQDGYAAIVKDGVIAVEFSDPPTVFTAKAHRLTSRGPRDDSWALEVCLEGRKARIQAPKRTDDAVLRLTLSMRPEGGDGPLGEYLIL